MSSDRVRFTFAAALLATGVIAIAVAVWSAAHGGIGWDTRYDTTASLAVRSLPPEMSLDKAYEAVPGVSELYGVLPQQLGDALHLLVTGSWERLGPDDPATYAYQGAASLLITVIAITALAAAVWFAFDSLLAGALTWSLTLSTPLWLGMSHVDFKDAPVAAGLTLFTAGLLVGLKGAPGWSPTIAATALAAAGATVALGTRAGSLVLLSSLLLAAIAAAGALSLASRRDNRTFAPDFRRLLAVSGGALGVGLATTWVTNPIARIAPFSWLQDAAELAASFPSVLTIRAAGEDLPSTNLPWWYVPAWLGVQLPLLTSAALLSGLVVTVYWVARHRPALDGRALALSTPLLVQGVVLPVVIVARRTVLYDGIRHLLFMLPALLALAAVAFAAAERRARATPGPHRILLPAVALLVVVASLQSAIRWAPYSYAYVNRFAGDEKGGRLPWELDYWGVTAREGVTRLTALGLTPVVSGPAADTGAPWGAVDADSVGSTEFGRYVFRRGDSSLGPECTRVFAIVRGGRLLGEGGRCPPSSS
ncbi:MAG: hypothetical protein U0R50_08915 [Gaiellales bacterium]